MTLNLTSRVFYSPNERLDLIDKLAEGTLSDETTAELLKGLIQDSTDGRVFRGWRTTTVNGPNVGFTIAAEAGFALSRDGKPLVRDGSTALTSALTTDAINYIHAYYEEAESDVDARRFYITGSEVTQNTSTRTTRSCNLYKTTASYGTGTPSFAAFSTSAVIGGVTRELLPLYAVAVNAGDTVTGVFDYRPMLAMQPGGATGNLYASSFPDFAHNFAPTNAATIGIVDIRSALIALADRLKDIKNTTNWYDSNFNDIHVNAGYGVHKAVNNDTLTLAGGNTATAGGNIILFGGTYVGVNANDIWYRATDHVFKDQSGSSLYAILASSKRLDLGDLVASDSPLAKLQLVSNTDPSIHVYSYGNSAEPDTVKAYFKRARGTRTTAINSQNNDVLFEDIYQGYYGGYYTAASISVLVDAVPGATVPGSDDVPGRIVLSTTPGASTTPRERLRISRNGYIGVLGSTSASGFDPSYLLDIRADGTGSDNASLMRCSADATSTTIALAKSRGSIASPAVAQINDVLGAIQFRGFNGVSTWFDCASISAQVTDTADAFSMSTRLSFKTRNSSYAAVEALSIEYDSTVYIGRDYDYCPGLKIRNQNTSTPIVVTNTGGYSSNILLGLASLGGTPVPSSQTLGGLQLAGYDGSTYAVSATVTAVTEELFSGSAHGTSFKVQLAGVGATTLRERLRVASDGLTCIFKSLNTGSMPTPDSTTILHLVRDGGNTANSGLLKIETQDATHGATGVILKAGSDANDWRIFTSTSADTPTLLRVRYNATDMMRINSTGVGIGAITPSYPLHVSGDSLGTGEWISTDDKGFRVAYTSCNYGVYHHTDASYYYLGITNSGDKFGTKNSLVPFRMALSTGDVYIGNNQLRVRHSDGVASAYVSLWSPALYGVGVPVSPVASGNDLLSRNAYNAVVVCAKFSIGSSGAPSLVARHFNVSGVTLTAYSQYDIALDQAVSTDSIIQVTAARNTDDVEKDSTGAGEPMMFEARFTSSTNIRINGWWPVHTVGSFYWEKPTSWLPSGSTINVVVVGSPTSIPSVP